MNLNFDDAIRKIESAIGYRLSDEQMRILKYDNQTPVLVNSCAGAGKTTLLEINCLVRIMRGEISAEQIVGITFSRKARADMKRKYKQMEKALLKKTGVEIKGMPNFETFHALFLHLLNKMQKQKGEGRLIPLVSPFSLRIHGKSPLFKAVKVQSPVKSTTDVINDVFRIRNYLINNQLSLDGLTYKSGNKKRPLTKKALIRLIGDDTLLTAMADYRSVMKAYTLGKRAENRIDFADMIVLLYKDIHVNSDLAIFRRLLAGVRFCFIDEFQDIDKMQWEIVRTLMKGEVDRHLMVVGDDDQSIYSFRGSDPTIIMELPNQWSSLKVFHLSTNYRTGGNILRTVAPLIACNRYRYAKKLNSSRDKRGQGQLIEFVNYKSPYQSSQALFNKFNQVIRDSAIKDSQVAILCRYNIDLMLAVDSLANEGYYVRTNKRHLLQNDRIYKSFIEIMKGLYTDRFEPLLKHVRQIGFMPYAMHIKAVERTTNHGRRFKHLSSYLKNVHDYDQYYLKKATRIPKTFQVDQRLSDLVKSLADTKTKHKCTELFNVAGDLLHNYYKYMISQHYLSQQTVVKIYFYLKGIIKNVGNQKIRGFFGFEKRKKYLLTHRSKQTRKFKIITIHAAKGLQFKYVFLYNLNTYGITSRIMMLDRFFKPHMMKSRFLAALMNVSIDELKKLTHNSAGYDIYAQWAMVLDDLRSYIESYGMRLPIISPRLRNELNNFYASAMAKVDDIEEERRLIYVAITRAEKRVYMNIDANTTPLAYELTVPNGNVITVHKTKNRSRYKSFKSRKMNRDGSRKHDVQTTLF